jgi:hypothetical protein
MRVYFLPVYWKGEGGGVADSIGVGGVDHVDLVDPVPDLFWKGGRGGGVGVYIPSHLHLWYSNFSMLKPKKFMYRVLED